MNREKHTPSEQIGLSVCKVQRVIHSHESNWSRVTTSLKGQIAEGFERNSLHWKLLI
jgi:hypothetical protein